jgi:hypothetical protein
MIWGEEKDGYDIDISSTTLHNKLSNSGTFFFTKYRSIFNF